ncbi:MAG: DUF4190 domain-containing protein, partial [Planctomycetaceae bacterium]
MAEFMCLHCKEVMEIPDSDPAPKVCTKCGSDDIAPVTFLEGTTMPKGSCILGFLSLVLGPLAGMPAIVLGLVALHQNKTPKNKAITGIIAGFIGTAGVVAGLIYLFSHLYNETRVAECELNLTRVALAQTQQPAPKTTTCPATMPAGWCITLPTTCPAGTTMPASAKVGTMPAETPVAVVAGKPTSTSAAASAPASMPTTAPYCYETTWPWTLAELVKKSPMTEAICPRSHQKYFYVPPTTTAPADAIVLADVADVHPGRCVLRVSGCAECISEDQFKAE